MNYVEVSFAIEPLLPGREVLIAELSEMGFESFVETEEGLQAYIQAPEFTPETLQELSFLQVENTTITHWVKEIEDQNWNAVWESNYPPIVVNDQCIVKAPFHTNEAAYPYEILIAPKMSFGTGHHDTTSLMLGTLLTMELEGLSVLDMGCGTGVLAILAAKKGAAPIEAIDIDEWAYNNTLENIRLNNCVDIAVDKGDVNLLEGKTFNIILANINKNVLLSDIKHYVDALSVGGNLLMSGFFDVDIPAIQTSAEHLGLELTHQKVQNSWAVVRFIKKSTR